MPMIDTSPCATQLADLARRGTGNAGVHEGK